MHSLLAAILKICTILASFVILSHSKVFTRCELGQIMLRNNFSRSELGDWVCLAEKCSKLNSSLVKSFNKTTSTVYGLFTLSNRWWCSDADYPEPQTNGCGIPCSRLVEGDSLTDTLLCARYVAAAKPDFGSWRDQFSYCKLRNTSTYIDECDFPEVTISGTPVDEHKENGTKISFVLPTAISILLLTFLLALGFLARKYERKLRRSKKQDEFTRKYSLSPKELILDKSRILGQGNFGIVYGGRYKSEKAAFKTVRRDADCISLIYELKVLAFLDQHPYITRLLGTYNDISENNKLYLVVEECQFGNLHDHLESNQSRCLGAGLIDSIDCKDPFYNYKQTTSRHFTPSENVSLNLMLTWSFQVAEAMVYLSSKNVIHGDLATRNVLLKDVRNVKLTDFGLSKKLYTNLIYERTIANAVPWRWLSPEALIYNQYSTKSDVWSFGVTLWEIYNLAQMPYPNISYAEYMRRLSEGSRLEKPDVALENLYEIMLSCWTYDPEARPSFRKLREKLLDHLGTNQLYYDSETEVSSSL